MFEADLWRICGRFVATTQYNKYQKSAKGVCPMPKDKNIVNEEPQQQNFQGKTILDTQKGSPYEKYSVLYLGTKGLPNIGIIAQFLDEKYKIPVKIPDTMIEKIPRK